MTELNKRSKNLRFEIIKLSKANGGYHYGGSFSCVEILVSLFDNCLNFDQDKFVMSKGHACWGYYVLLHERGLKPLLEGHPHRDVHNGIEWTTGSEGHGMPAAVGMALARKLKKQKGKIFVFPIVILRFLAMIGDLMQKVGWREPPFNTFRLNNMLTGARYPIEKTEEIIGPLPFTFEEGIRETLDWMYEHKLVIHKTVKL